MPLPDPVKLTLFHKQLWAIESESVLALCFHELDSRGMLGAAVGLLPQGCQGQVHDIQLLRERIIGVAFPYSRHLHVDY
jgi:hypothetical protein